LQALAGAVLGAFAQAEVHAADLEDPWLRDLFDQARMQLDLCLAHALIGEIQSSLPRHPPDEMLAFGAGTLWLRCPRLGIELLADAGVLRHVPPRPSDAAPSPRSGLQSLQVAARDATLPLSVGLGSVELDLVRLLGLQPGDVLRLQTRLDDRLPVTLGGQALAQCFLGHLGRHKAVQLASLPNESLSNSRTA
jgi:flagellar motor switch/type III secretory pathway protein FliN